VKLIVGLGNPGKQYEGTRHNVGFAVIDVLAKRWRIDLTTEKFHAWHGTGDVRGERVALMKPTTFMNRSGQAVQAAGRFYKLEVADLLVISDDLALPPGRLRMRANGSSGGHNGLEDVGQRLGGFDWCRLRLGIGEAVGSGAGYVLGRFSADDESLMDIVYQRAADAVECWLENGAELTMTRFNGDVEGK